MCCGIFYNTKNKSNYYSLEVLEVLKISLQREQLARQTIFDGILFKPILESLFCTLL